MKSKQHLSLFGVGPVYVITITVITVIVLFFHYTSIIATLEIPLYIVIFLRTIAVLCMILGVLIWLGAVFSSRITQNIKENHLITDGVYGIVRHPVYSAFTLLEAGMLLFTGNLWLSLFIPLYWLFFTILVKHTEEKWLLNLYGKDYEDYCKRVNRCIPWFPKKR